MNATRRGGKVLLVLLATAWAGPWRTSAAGAAEGRFVGAYFEGKGDVEYLELLDISRRVFEPDPQFQHLAMLYTPAWNGLVEGPTWGAWWIQNSYGPTYCALPFLQEPFVTFVNNSHDLWFNQMGDGKTPRPFGNFHLIPPDGCLCDAASPDWFVAKQGDGRVEIHDWCMEFTAAGLLLQAENLLISRDAAAIARDLPRLRRCAGFIESRRDPKNNLFLAGPAGNLLAPSYAGRKNPDGTYGQAYLAGLSITYIAALDRLIELETLAGHADNAKLDTDRRDRARQGLALVTTPEGYFIKSLDPDGTRHGVYGAAKYGYFEAVSNHDAICFRVADDAQSRKIYDKLASIPGLRPHGLIITNYPSLDDMYERPTGLWEFGRWVNGGHWTTCEARMIMAYDRLGKYDDARRAMKKILEYYRRFRTDNPLVDFGGNVYQPGEPINCVYDTWGAPAAMVRGLFEYLYRADGLTVLPHVPPGVTELRQRFPIRLGTKRLYLSTVGSGPVTGVTLNGRPYMKFDAATVTLPDTDMPSEAHIQILLGGARPLVLDALSHNDQTLPAAGTPLDAAGQHLFPLISSNTLPLRIGAAAHGENRFRGDIARAWVFSRALVAAEVAALAADRSDTLDKDPALVGDWRLDALQAGVFRNAAGLFLPARIVGDVQPVDGLRGKAVRLAGLGYLEVAHDARLDLRACTLAAWVRPEAQPQAGGRIIDKARVGTSNGYLLDTFPGNSLRLIVERGCLAFDAKLPPGKWCHVAATVAIDGTMALYLDGRRVAFQPPGPATDLLELDRQVARLRRFHAALVSAGMADRYEAAHARLAVRCAAVCGDRMRLLAAGTLARLPEASQVAADRSYFATASRVCEGLARVLDGYKTAQEPTRKRLHALWLQAAGTSGS